MEANSASVFFLLLHHSEPMAAEFFFLLFIFWKNEMKIEIKAVSTDFLDFFFSASSWQDINFDFESDYLV